MKAKRKAPTSARDSAPARKPLPPTGDPRRYVFHKPLQCRDCHGLNLRTYRTTKPAGAFPERHTECLDCGATFIAIAEVESFQSPESG